MKKIICYLLLAQALIAMPVAAQTHLNTVTDWGGATLRGLWLFDNQVSPLSATTGNDLVLKAVTTPTETASPAHPPA